jgi:branched-chain amino acid transport system permease protein
MEKMTFSHQLSQYVLTGLGSGSIYALIGIGFNIIHNATRIVNITQCAFVMLGGMLCISFFTFLHLPLSVSFFLAILSVTFIGAMVERGAIRPAKSKSILVLIFITIGAYEFMSGTAMLAWGPDPMTLPSFSGEKPLRVFGATLDPQYLWIFGITLLTVIILHLFFSRTITGKAIRAVAVNPQAASLVGISVNRMTLISFALSGTVGAIAGIIITPITTASYQSGLMLGLKGFAAAILGGYGNMFGAVVGGVILGTLENLSAGLITSEYKNALAFLILLLVLFIRPSGLLGEGEAERV